MQGDQKELADQVQGRLFDWWRNNARDLPWRFGRTTPWGVLVSEVMSQQTQMSRVVPYWTLWMETWPDAQALALAGKAEVITAWGRLGYPRRALRLQECAQVLVASYDGQLPRTYKELIELPGIGDYTASALMSFAFGERIAVIDTNIRRVLSRVFLGVESVGGTTSPAERDLAARLLPEDDFSQNRSSMQIRVQSTEGSTPQEGGVVSGLPSRGGDPSSSNAPVSIDTDQVILGERGPIDLANMTIGSPQWYEPASAKWNQSLMELGALVCTAKKPACQICPLAGQCLFLKSGLPGLGHVRTRPRQSFVGTNRQIRGKILEALRASRRGQISRKEVESLCPDQVQLDLCIASLDNDGLLVIQDDRSLRLPS